MSVFQCFLLFVIFSLVWIVTNFVWKLIEIRLAAARQKQLLDMIYANIMRMFIHGAAELQSIKRGRGNKND